MFGLCGPGAAVAQQWSLQTGVVARIESNSNPALASDGADAFTTSTLSTTVTALRSTEISESRAEAELVLAPTGRRSGQNTSGRLALKQRLSAARHTGSVSLSLRRDEPQDAPRTASDVVVGAAGRSATDGSLAWSHVLSERLSTQFDGSRAATRYRVATAAGGDFDLWSANAGLRYALGEPRSMGLTLGHTAQRPSRGGSRSTVDNLRLSFNETLTETSSLSLSLGVSATTREFTLTQVVCPLPVAYCQAGLTPYVLAGSEQRQRSRDLQYSAAYSGRWNEVSGLSASVSRALTPGALGVTREDTLGVSLNTALSEYLGGALSYDESRSRAVVAAGASTATLRTLSLSFSHRLGERLSLSGELKHRRYDRSSLQSGATANLISISLQYQGDTVTGWP